MLRSAAISGMSAILTLATASIVAAETFTCEFTEPWVTLTYSASSGRVMMKEDRARSGRIVARHVSLRHAGPGVILLFDARGAQVARLELTGKGTDGMSDKIYPYSITTHLIANSSGSGGCYTTLLKSRIAE